GCSRTGLSSPRSCSRGPTRRSPDHDEADGHLGKKKDSRVRFDLDSEQEFFQETTARFLEDQVPVATLRALRDDRMWFAPDSWRRGAELGWTSLLVGEAHGGGSISGDGLVDLSVIAHEFGRHAAPGPLVTTNVVADALTRAGDAHVDTLGELLAGTVIAS